MTGWCVYDGQLNAADHLDAVTRLRPDVVRWFCSVDRHVWSASPAVDWQTRYGAAFRVLADTRTALVVQLQMKRPDWSGGDAGNVVGAQSWRQSNRCGWLRDPDLWTQFVTRLAAELTGNGVAAMFGAWNEPDWRIGWFWEKGAGGSNPLAPTVPWEEGRWLWWPVPPAAPFGWSGGFDKLSDLREGLPLRWTSDGVGPLSDWLRLTAADPTVSVIDVHTYHGGNVATAVNYAAEVVDAFDTARTDKLPIVVGEYGDDANGTPYTGDWAARAVQFRALLDARYPGRVLGICAHLQGTRQGVTYPALWQVL